MGVAYLRRRYRLSAAGEEMAVADLWMAGTLGVVSETAPDGAVVLTAYFEGPEAAAAPAPPLAGGGAIEYLGEEELPETDWLAEYRRQARPFALGARLVIDPREPDDGSDEAVAADEAGGPAAAPRRLLRLPARTAFGVGSHESTALAIALLEAEDLHGRRVLDVGTGTGILAFAALAWGAAQAVAFDIDPVAAFQARINSRLNGLRPLLFAGRPAALAPHPGRTAHGRAPAPGFDLAMINVVPEQILPDLADLLPALLPAGGIILSGLLAQRAPEVTAHFAALGFVEVARRQDGDWAALRLAPGGA
jgi:ribosomal protein L11 methyltransferase